MKKILSIACMILLILFSCNTNQTPKEASKQQTPDSLALVETPKEEIIEPSITQEEEETPLKETPKQASQKASKAFPGFSGFYAQFEKKPQSFTINTATDNTINCKEGTQITFKANSLETLDGQAVDGPVNIKVKEYYQFSDMMNANLNTMSNDRLLETGGMINVEAFYKGKKCRLKSGKAIDIDFPNAPDDMELFDGQWSNGNVNWTVAPVFEQEIENFSIGYELDSFATPPPRKSFKDEEITKIIQNAIEYPEFARKKRLQGRAHVRFFSLEDGSIVEPYISFKMDTLFENAAIAAVKKLPKGLFGYENKQHSISFKFNMKDGFDNMGKVTFSIKLDDGKFDDSVIPPSIAEIARTTEKRNKNRNVRSQINILMRSSNLGWINCDRFIKYDGPKTNFIVGVQQAKHLNLKIVFNDINSIMRGYRTNGKIIFSEIPENKAITIVAIKYENEQYYLAVKETNTNDKNPILSYQLATKERIKEEMLKLNRV